MFLVIYHSLSILELLKPMSVKISYLNKNIGKYTSNTVSFVDEKFNIKNLKKYFSAEEFSYIDIY